MIASESTPRPAPLVEPGPPLVADEFQRYARHLSLPGFGAIGQRRLKAARVLVVGAGGLGSPVLAYLAAAGVGTLGVIDDDVVEPSNLQRQVIHSSGDVGRLKTESARAAIGAINPLVEVDSHAVRLTDYNAVDLFARYDLVVDGSDNFATRYVVSDAAGVLGMPCVWGSILHYGAQVSVFWNTFGPGYRDLYPDAPTEAPTCESAGVLGMLCGAAGSIMAAEAVKLITGTGRSLLGRLAVFDLGEATWREYRIACDPPATGEPGRHTPGAANRLASGSRRPAAEVHEMAPSELRARLCAPGNVGLELIDVRDAGEYEVAHIEGARSLPLQQLGAEGALRDIASGRAGHDTDVVVYCTVGTRSRAAAAILSDAGFPRVSVLAGGMERWMAESSS